MAWACRNKKTQYVQDDTKSDEDDNDELRVCIVYTDSKRRGIHIAFEIEGKKVEISLDIGTQATLISEIMYQKFLSHLPLQNPHVNLFTFTK